MKSRVSVYNRIGGISLNNKYSVDDILSELENKKSAAKTSDDEFSKIMEEILGKKPAETVMPTAKEEPKPQPNTEPKAETKPEPKPEPEPKKEVKTEAKPEPIAETSLPEKKEELKRPSGDTITFDKSEVVKRAEKTENFKVKIDYEQEEQTPAEIEDEKIVPSKSAFEDATIQMEPFGITENPATAVSAESVNQDIVEFRESRKQKVEKFVLFGDDEEENELEAEPIEPEEDVKTIEDFNDYSEATAIVKDLSGIKASLTLRLIVLSALSLFSAYIELGSYIGIPIPDIFSRTAQPLSYLIVSVLAFVAALLVSAPAVFGGFASLFGFKADGLSGVSRRIR